MDAVRKEFGRQVRLYRKERNLLQEELAARLGVRQATLSAWEVGRQMPTSVHFNKLVTNLELPETEVSKLRKLYARLSMPELSGEPTEQTVRLAKTEADGAFGECRYDLWLLGPSTLPVIDNRAIQDIWAKQLTNGVNYWIVWFVDKLENSKLREVENALLNVAELCLRGCGKNAPKGKIYHVPLLLGAGDRFQSSRISFKRFFDDLTANDDVKSLNQPEYGLLNTQYADKNDVEAQYADEVGNIVADVSAHWMYGSSLAVYMPHGVGTAMANIRLPQFRRERDLAPEESARLWWLADEDEAQLHGTLRKLESLVEEARGDSHPKSRQT